MVYQNKLVAAVKVNGKILREHGNSVTLPFGSEYSVLLKNLNSVRVMVKVSVDSTDATEGTWLIIQPNSSLELERFIKGGNLQSGNRFKFIERTKEIEDHRGIKEDDGLIRVEYKTERRVVEQPVIHQKHYYWDYYERYYDPWRPHYPRPYPKITWTSNTINSTSTGMRSSMCAMSKSASSGNHSVSAQNVSYSTGNFQSANDAGITVPGSQSNQQFYHASSFDTESQSEVIVLHLRGEVGGQVVQEPITVKQKLLCPTCGRKNRSNNSFCYNCGTALGG